MKTVPLLSLAAFLSLAAVPVLAQTAPAANPLRPAAPAAVPKAAPAAPETPAASAPKAAPSAGLLASRERQKACGAEWKQKRAAGQIPAGQKWPQFWSACNTRMKAAGQ